MKGTANTKKNYLPHLQRFTDLTEKKPKGLIENAESELNKTLKKREIFKLVLRFHNHLEDKGLAPKSMRS